MSKMVWVGLGKSAGGPLKRYISLHMFFGVASHVKYRTVLDKITGGSIRCQVC